MNNVKTTRERFSLVLSDTTKVGAWVFISAGLTGLVSYLLEKPELINYYGVLNIVLYLIKKIGEEFNEGK